MFGKEKREKDERIQRMLAREQGRASEPEAPPAAPAPARGGRPGKKAQKPAGAAGPGKPAPKTKKISALAQRRRRRRRSLLIAAVLVLAALFALATGALGSSLAALGDVADSVTLYFNRGAGWPVSTGISDPLRVEELAGGFVELGREDVSVYSAYGAKVRAFQPGYARPAIAVGNTRFCVYNRAGSELRVESRTKNLYTKSFENSILLCAMSNNGTLAVVTESSRYAAQVTVYDALFGQRYSWSPTQEQGTPVALRFAADNHRFAAGCLAAVNGQLSTVLYMMDTASTQVVATYTADAGSMILEMDWLSYTRVLAVFDDYAAIINPADGSESVRFEYGGATLQSVSTAAQDTVLLLSGRQGSTLTVLDDTLSTLASVPVGQADSVRCTRTAVYVLGNTGVEQYAFDGTLQGRQELESHPLAVVDAEVMLVFYGTRAEELAIKAA